MDLSLRMMRLDPQNWVGSAACRKTRLIVKWGKPGCCCLIRRMMTKETISRTHPAFRPRSPGISRSAFSRSIALSSPASNRSCRSAA